MFGKNEKTKKKSTKEERKELINNLIKRCNGRYNSVYTTTNYKKSIAHAIRYCDEKHKLSETEKEYVINEVNNFIKADKERIKKMHKETKIIEKRIL